VWTDFIWLIVRTHGGLFEHGIELAISINCGALPEKLRKILQDSVPWSCSEHFLEYTDVFFLVCLALLTNE
jgi:hypothetical protein